MKKFYLSLAVMAITMAVHSQTIFTYGKDAVSKEEFLRAYNKNSTPVTDKEKALRDYLELYSNFKLKVKAAQELHLDTLPQIRYDIENFRHQVVENYMSDEKGMTSLMDEAFDRSQKDLHVIHFLVRINPEASPEDTVRAYRNINDAYTALNSGETDYKLLSEKKDLQFGDLGFITVFTLPYGIENVIYSLKPGQASKPYHLKNSWHVFKVVEERKSAGKWKIAQILFTYPPEADEATRIAIQHRADSVYQLLKAGADFTKAAKEYSDDKLTYMTGGEIPEFVSGRYDYGYEKEVYKLKTDGEISKPFSSQFGVHIIKRLANTPTPTERDNAALQFDLKQKLLQDARINSAKEKFAKEIISMIGYKKASGVKDADLFRLADSTMKDPAVQYPEKLAAISNKTIISFKNGSLKGSDWLKFVRDYKSNPEQYKGETNAELWDKYVMISSLEYYKDHLEEYNADFRFQMKEFKEGNMLFEIMERNVWSKAATDTVGLLKQYNADKTKYKWAASADVLIFNCSTEKTALDAIEAVKKGKSWKDITNDSNGAIQGDSGRYELAQIGIENAAAATAGNFSGITKNSDGTATFVKYIHIYPADQQRSFDEARGLIINDYQAVLEKQWLDALRKKYPVVINETVVKGLLN